MLLSKSRYSSTIKLRGLLWRALDWLYPPLCCNCNQIGREICPTCWDSISLLADRSTCAICGKILEHGPVCPDCQKNPPAYDQLKSWALYEGAARSMVTGIKFERKLGLVPYLVEPLANAIAAWKPDVDAITPVSLGRKRQQTRGYNQSALIARKVAAQLNMHYSERILSRVRETHTQVGLNAKERQENMVDAFKAEADLCRGKSFLIFDDIATTGATLNACAKALRSAGAINVFCFTVARTSISNPIFTEVSNERQC